MFNSNSNLFILIVATITRLLKLTVSKHTSRESEQSISFHTDDDPNVKLMIWQQSSLLKNMSQLLPGLPPIKTS